MLSVLETAKLDWSDFEKAGEESRMMVRTLASDKSLLKDLVYGVENNPELLAKCERHELLDYIVIYDALDRGFRIRVHLSTNVHQERPHDHRFSFSSYIVTGSYLHTWHRVEEPIYAEQDDEGKRWHSKKLPDPRDEISPDFVKPILVRKEQAGSCYSLHHSIVHTTLTTPDTVSLFVRGPAEKERSLIYDKDSGKYWWRWGKQDETSERRKDKRMSITDYREFRDRLHKLGVI